MHGKHTTHDDIIITTKESKENVTSTRQREWTSRSRLKGKGKHHFCVQHMISYNHQEQWHAEQVQCCWEHVPQLTRTLVCVAQPVGRMSRILNWITGRERVMTGIGDGCSHNKCNTIHYGHDWQHSTLEYYSIQTIQRDTRLSSSLPKWCCKQPDIDWPPYEICDDDVWCPKQVHPIAQIYDLHPSLPYWSTAKCSHANKFGWRSTIQK